MKRPSTPLHRLLAPLRRLIFRKSVAVVANSPGLKEMSERVDPYPVQVIPNGVDTDFFSPSEIVEDVKHRPFAFLFRGPFSDCRRISFTSSIILPP